MSKPLLPKDSGTKKKTKYPVELEKLRARHGITRAAAVQMLKRQEKSTAEPANPGVQ